MIIKLQFQKKVEKYYSHEIQSLYKIFLFGLLTKNKACFVEIDQQLLKNIIHKAKKKVFLLSSMIMTVGLFFSIEFIFNSYLNYNIFCQYEDSCYFYYFLSFRLSK